MSEELPPDDYSTWTYKELCERLESINETLLMLKTTNKQIVMIKNGPYISEHCRLYAITLSLACQRIPQK